MLPADVLDVFEKRLAGLPRPVTIEYFQTGGSRLTVPGRVALPPCPDCRSTLELLQEVTAVSDLVSLGVHEFGHDPQLAAEYDVDRVPGIVVNGGSGRRLPLYGLPLGHFLPVLLDAMLRVAREPGEPPEEVTRILDEVDEAASGAGRRFGAPLARDAGGDRRLHAGLVLRPCPSLRLRHGELP